MGHRSQKDVDEPELKGDADEVLQPDNDKWHFASMAKEVSLFLCPSTNPKTGFSASNWQMHTEQLNVGHT